MKKLFLIFWGSFALLFFLGLAGKVSAIACTSNAYCNSSFSQPGVCVQVFKDPKNCICSWSFSKSNPPCNLPPVPICNGPNGTDDGAKGFVPCGVTVINGTAACPCQIRHIFIMLINIYDFLVKVIALPLAGLMIFLGAVLLIVSGGNPGMASTSKNILKYSFMGLALVFGSWLIINFVLKSIGYVLQWHVLEF